MEVRMTMEEYEELLARTVAMGADPISGILSLSRQGLSPGAMVDESVLVKPRKRKTRYQAAYKRNFNKIKSNYTKKDGTWKKGGFKRAVKEAHR